MRSRHWHTILQAAGIRNPLPVDDHTSVLSLLNIAVAKKAPSYISGTQKMCFWAARPPNLYSKGSTKTLKPVLISLFIYIVQSLLTFFLCVGVYLFIHLFIWKRALAYFVFWLSVCWFRKPMVSEFELVALWARWPGEQDSCVDASGWENISQRRAGHSL